MTLTFSDFEIQRLTQLDPDDVAAVLDRLVGQVQELHPELDLQRGVLRDLLLYHHAVLETAIRTNLERYQSARSLQQIEADPTLADDYLVEQVLSNWGITRRIGTAAAGSITIEVEQARTITIPEGFLFEARGHQYATTATFTARISETQVTTENDRLLVPLSNGNWAFTVDVEATEIGEQAKLNAGDLVTPNRPLVGHVSSYATSTFSGGVNTETNEELLNELQLGLSGPGTVSNRINFAAWIRSQPELQSITNQSIVGYGDPEMLRDQHTIFPISYGGRIDHYIRGQSRLQRVTLPITATLTEITSSVSIWQFSLARDTFPGFYEVQKIRRAVDAPVNSGFNIVSDTRGVDLTGDKFVPDIVSTEEGAYTSFQTGIFRFEDTVTPVTELTVGQTAEFICEVTGVPLIREVQELMSARETRSLAADILVKAPVPCFVEVTLTINKTAGEASPDVSQIKEALVEEINYTDFIGRLDGSRLIDVVHRFISGHTSVTGLDLFGRIRRPDGQIQYLRSSDSLQVPDQPQLMVTAKTVQFFAEPDNISINVQSAIPTAK